MTSIMIKMKQEPVKTPKTQFSLDWVCIAWSVFCAEVLQDENQCKIFVLLESDANFGRDANERSNLDVNYSAQLIMKRLMRHTAEESNGRLAIDWLCVVRCVLALCLPACEEERRWFFGPERMPELRQLLQGHRWGFLVNMPQYVLDKHCMQSGLQRDNLHIFFLLLAELSYTGSPWRNCLVKVVL